MSAELRAACRAASAFELLRAWEHAHPDRPRVGGSGPAGDESVRLRGHPGLGFPVRDVHDAAVVGERLRVDVTFLTLHGHDASLPDHDVLAVLRAPDERARDFLDVFGHRLLSLLYAAWARTRADVGEPARVLLGALIDPVGRGPAAWHRPDLRVRGVRSAAHLAQAVSAQLDGAPVRVEPCVPQRVEVPSDQRMVVGVRCCRLGVDAVLGACGWAAAGRFRLHVGPVGAEAARGLRRGGPLHRAVSSLVRAWLAAPLDWTLRVTIRAEHVCVGVLAGEGAGSALGVDTWLGRPRAALVSTEIPPIAGEEDP